MKSTTIKSILQKRKVQRLNKKLYDRMIAGDPIERLFLLESELVDARYKLIEID